MTFKEKIINLRKIRGLTQDEFAKAVGVSRQAVYKWECGQSYPEVPKLLEIKALFNVSIDDLLDDRFEVALPEKKKRKRIKKEVREKIEENVREEFAKAAEKIVIEAEKEKVSENTDIKESEKEEKVSEDLKVAETVLIKDEAETVSEACAEEKTPIDEKMDSLAPENEEAPILLNAETENEVSQVLTKEEPDLTKAENVKENDPISQEKLSDSETKSEEDAKIVPVTENKEEEKTEKKRGFFQRLFGRK